MNALLLVLLAQAADGRIAVLSDTPDSRFVRSLRALYPGRVDLNPDAAALEKCRYVVADRPDASVRSGKTAIVDLDVYARLRGLRVTTETLANENSIPPLGKEQVRKLSDAAAKLSPNAPHPGAPRWVAPGGNLPEPWMNEVVAGIRKEMLEPIPRVRIVEECRPFTNGFAAGDTVPWCGQEKGRYVQRQLERLPEGAVAIAVSTLNDRPVFVREGAIFALDFRSLGEPEVTWETRGSFNKYVFAGNVLGRSIRLGRYWTRKPLAEEWPRILEDVAKKHPALRVEVDGFTKGYNVQSLNLGDPSKPVWYAFGMYHAEDEWRSALGLVDFMRYLADHKDDPEIQARLEKYCVKAVPCQVPTMYMKALRGDEPGPERPLVENPSREPLDLVMAFSIHECDAHLQYGIIPMTSKSFGLLGGLEAEHRRRIADRFVEWDGGKPVQADAKSWRGGDGGEAGAERHRYYGFGIGFDPLYRIGKPSFERLPYEMCVEGGRRGFLPEVFLQHYQLRGLVWEEDLYRSAVMNEMIATWVLSAFLTCPQDAGSGLHLDFSKENPGVRLVNGAKPAQGGLEFTTPIQYAEVDFPRKLDGIQAMTVGGWFFPRGRGEQYFFFRGLPEYTGQGERWFRPSPEWVGFALGTDSHGFLMGAVHGNGSMPFPHVTLNEVPFGSWSQLVAVKDGKGFQKFYRNGTLVHSDHESCYAPKVTDFKDTGEGPPVRLAMPFGGIVGEAWIHPRELSAEEILRDFEAKKSRYHPALPAEPVLLREMDVHPRAGQWKEPITAETWPKVRERIREGYTRVFGRMPKEKVPLDPKVISEEDCGTYVRRKVSIQVQRDDRMPAYVLIPKNRKGRVPAVLCVYGTTGGAGKETTVGLSGSKPGTPPVKNRGFAVDLAEAGFVAFAADYLRDGERIKPGRRPYDTTDFYQEFPDWSIHGKDAWDTGRAIDYLETLDFVDPEKIGMTGHSYGGHSTIFTAAVEPRIKAAWANGPVSEFIHYGMHWAAPKGSGGSASLPGMRPYVLDPTTPAPITFYEVTALIAPRPLVVGQAVGERRPLEEESAAAVQQVYQALGAGDRVRHVWYPGDHDYPPHVRKEAVAWFRRWLR